MITVPALYECRQSHNSAIALFGQSLRGAQEAVFPLYASRLRLWNAMEMLSLF